MRKNNYHQTCDPLQLQDVLQSTVRVIKGLVTLEIVPKKSSVLSELLSQNDTVELMGSIHIVTEADKGVNFGEWNQAFTFQINKSPKSYTNLKQTLYFPYVSSISTGITFVITGQIGDLIGAKREHDSISPFDYHNVSAVYLIQLRNAMPSSGEISIPFNFPLPVIDNFLEQCLLLSTSDMSTMKTGKSNHWSWYSLNPFVLVQCNKKASIITIYGILPENVTRIQNIFLSLLNSYLRTINSSSDGYQLGKEMEFFSNLLALESYPTINFQQKIMKIHALAKKLGYNTAEIDEIDQILSLTLDYSQISPAKRQYIERLVLGFDAKLSRITRNLATKMTSGGEQTAPRLKTLGEK